MSTPLKHYMPGGFGKSACGLCSDPDPRRGTPNPKDGVNCLKCRGTERFKQDARAMGLEDETQSHPRMFYVLHRIADGRRTLLAVDDYFEDLLRCVPYRLTAFERLPEGRAKSICPRADQVWVWRPPPTTIDTVSLMTHGPHFEISCIAKREKDIYDAE